MLKNRVKFDQINPFFMKLILLNVIKMIIYYYVRLKVQLFMFRSESVHIDLNNINKIFIKGNLNSNSRHISHTNINYRIISLPFAYLVIRNQLEFHRIIRSVWYSLSFSLRSVCVQLSTVICDRCVSLSLSYSLCIHIVPLLRLSLWCANFWMFSFIYGCVCIYRYICMCIYIE